MNVKNNKRRQASQEKIEKTFVELLQTKDISKITVSEIVKACEINRTTFYANYLDIYDLADKIRDKLEQSVEELYEYDATNRCGIDYLRLFQHIKDNQIFYNTYFKLGYDEKHKLDIKNIDYGSYYLHSKHLEYHIEFHKAGLNAIIKKWLASGCKESPETMVEIIEVEYGTLNTTK